MLNKFRNKINLIDNALLNLIALRMEMACEIGIYKKSRKIKIILKRRISKMLLNYKDRARKLNLNEKDVEKIFEILIRMSISKQKGFN